VEITCAAEDRIVAILQQRIGRGKPGGDGAGFDGPANAHAANAAWSKSVVAAAEPAIRAKAGAGEDLGIGKVPSDGKGRELGGGYVAADHVAAGAKLVGFDGHRARIAKQRDVAQQVAARQRERAERGDFAQSGGGGRGSEVAREVAADGARPIPTRNWKRRPTPTWCARSSTFSTRAR
jgi:hypothetical protein